MSRCKACGSKAELINGVEYYGSHTAFMGISLLAGVAVSVISREVGRHTAHELYNNCTKDLHKKYKCTNPKCNCEWFEY